MIKPNEKHIIKAVAWDALWSACDLQEQMTMEGHAKESAKNLKKIMNEILNRTGETLSDPETWEEKGDGDAG